MDVKSHVSVVSCGFPHVLLGVVGDFGNKDSGVLVTMASVCFGVSSGSPRVLLVTVASVCSSVRSENPRVLLVTVASVCFSVSSGNPRVLLVTSGFGMFQR